MVYTRSPFNRWSPLVSILQPGPSTPSKTTRLPQYSCGTLKLAALTALFRPFVNAINIADQARHQSCRSLASYSLISRLWRLLFHNQRADSESRDDSESQNKFCKSVKFFTRIAFGYFQLWGQATDVIWRKVPVPNLGGRRLLHAGEVANVVMRGDDDMPAPSGMEVKRTRLNFMDSGVVKIWTSMTSTHRQILTSFNLSLKYYAPRGPDNVQEIQWFNDVEYLIVRVSVEGKW